MLMNLKALTLIVTIKIDNDGDADKSDEYLHNRRKAISKAVKEDAAITNEEAEFDEAQIMLEGAIDLAKRIIKRGVGTVTGSRAKAHAELADMIRHKNVSNMFSMGINKADKKEHAAQMKKSENKIRAHIKKHDLGPLTKESVDEAKKMSISGKQIKAALASAKAQAKPKDQVSLKKAPFDIPKESFDVDSLLAIFEKLEESQIDLILANLDEQQLDEISNKTIDSYRKKAYGQYKTSADKRGDSVYFGSAKPETRAKHAARYAKRHKGIGSADKRTMARDPDNFKFGRVGRDGHDPKNDSMSSKTVDDMRKIKGYSNKKESWTILNRIQEKAIAPRDMNHVKGATPPETMDSKESPKAKEFAATSGVPASVTLDANVVAQQTADAIRASAAKISGNSNRSNDQKTGDKNIIKSTVAESKAFTKFRSFFS
jgi:hypothetical protein